MSVSESTFSSVASTNHADRNTLAKVTRRLIPFLFACYVLKRLMHERPADPDLVYKTGTQG